MSRCKGLEVLYPIPEGRWNEHAVPVSCSPTLTNVPWGKGARQMPFLGAEDTSDRLGWWSGSAKD